MELEILQNLAPWDWPSDARTTLRKILINRFEKPADRLLAAKLAGDFTVIDDKLAATLLKVLRDPIEPDELRGASAIAFGAALEQADIEMMDDGEFDDPEAVPISKATFREIQDTLRTLYADPSVPKLVRRRILEATVRAMDTWHHDAIAAAYATGDPEWVLTAVFAMRFVDGFEAEVLEALNSTDPEIFGEAVEAAGEKELAAAWPRILGLLNAPKTPKALLLAAIPAAANIRPSEAEAVLQKFSRSEDRAISESAQEAIFMASTVSAMDADDDGDDDDGDDDDGDDDDGDDDETDATF